MDKSELAPVVISLCNLHRKQFVAYNDLVLHLAAIGEVLKDRGDKDFQSDLQKKIQILKQGEIGKQIVQDIRLFDQEIGRIRSIVL